MDGIAEMCLAVTVAVAIVVGTITYAMTNDSWEQEVIKHGCAFYKPDGKRGEFVWK